MSTKVILHLSGEDPILAEMAALPGPADQFITVLNPRKRDGKALHYLTDGATSFLYPLARISFIEIMGGEEETAKNQTSLIAFFREDALPKRR
ncbi:MAG: hypothetical protein IT340_18670 [Chloroflexi bacterium]|nr:hypothetical protein [Chloroflexota bacterium]